MWTDEMQSEFDQILVLARLLDYEINVHYYILCFYLEGLLLFELMHDNNSFQLTQNINGKRKHKFVSLDNDFCYPLRKLKELL